MSDNDWYGFSQKDDKDDRNGSGDEDLWGIGVSDSKSNDTDDSLEDFFGGTQSGKSPRSRGSKKRNKGSLIKWFKGLSGKGKLVVSIGTVVSVGVLTTIGVVIAKGEPLPYEQTPFYALDGVSSVISQADVESLGDPESSYLAYEWDYFNGIEVRENFYNDVMSTVSFDYKENSINENELFLAKSLDVPVEVSYIDWGKVTNDMRDFDFEKIQSMYKEAKINKSNYEFEKELTNLYASYISSLEELPTKQTWVDLPMSYDETESGYSWYLTSDVKLDKMLFSSDEFHNSMDVFAGIATGDIGTLETNPNHESWKRIHDDLTKQLEQEKSNLAEYNKAVTNDNGTVLYKDEDGNTEKVINLDENGIAKSEEKTEEVEESNRPDKKPKKEEEQEETFSIEAPVSDDVDFNIVNATQHQLEIMEANEPLPTYIKPPNKDYKLAQGVMIPYTWVGAYYLNNNYKHGDVETVVLPQEGDGTRDFSLGFNTPVVTHMRDEEGNFHDVIVTLKKVFKGQDAIDYAVSFDNRNRGFDLSSDRGLMALEFEVENLSDKDLTLVSEFSLADKDANLVSRTGKMYNFARKSNIGAGKTATMQDWVNNAELEDSYLIWGESFKREFEPVWFRQLVLTSEDDDSVPEEMKEAMSGDYESADNANADTESNTNEESEGSK